MELECIKCLTTKYKTDKLGLAWLGLAWLCLDLLKLCFSVCAQLDFIWLDLA